MRRHRLITILRARYLYRLRSKLLARPDHVLHTFLCVESNTLPRHSMEISLSLPKSLQKPFNVALRLAYEPIDGIDVAEDIRALPENWRLKG